ncbi:PH domain-containing protein [Streptomyces sp. NPDC001698]|uniref:PH domain-containing protein n=1 Tax=Streptomyces sp. NPDC001698 TaxID=3364601 RepID=UPI0036B20734
MAEQDSQARIYRPRGSLGWLWLALLAVLLLASGWFGGGSTRVVGTVIGVAVAVLALCFPAMRYTVDGESVRLTYGPLLGYRISRSDIVAVSRADLTPTLWAAVRLPGIALYTVRYSGVGAIRMCSTRVAQGVLVIEIRDGRRYGVSPEQEGGFVAEVTGGSADRAE